MPPTLKAKPTVGESNNPSSLQTQAEERFDAVDGDGDGKLTRGEARAAGDPGLCGDGV